jgi:PAS domain S-box-containing protein
VSVKLSGIFNQLKQSASFKITKRVKSLIPPGEIFSEIYDSVSAAILVFNGEELVYINSEVTRLTKYTKDEIAEKIRSSEIIHPDFRNEMMEVISACEKSEVGEFDLDLKITDREGGAKWTHCFMKSKTFFNKTFKVVTAHDITENKMKEYRLNEYIEELHTNKTLVEENAAQMTELNSRLTESERKLKKLIADKDKFLFIISHDLRTPFNSVLGFAEILMSDIEILAPSEISLFAHHIHESASNLVSLLTSLLEWARLGNGKADYNPEMIELEEIVDETILILYNNAHKKNILLHRDLMNGLTVFADRKMFNSILQNLITNAIKFTHRNGSILISAQRENDFIKVSVKDNGIGICRNDIGKLFRIDEHHSTTGTENEKGTGLGLSLCKDLVEMNKGKIWVESTLSEGSIFHFTLPIFVETDLEVDLLQA